MHWQSLKKMQIRIYPLQKIRICNHVGGDGICINQTRCLILRQKLLQTVHPFTIFFVKRHWIKKKSPAPRLCSVAANEIRFFIDNFLLRLYTIAKWWKRCPGASWQFLHGTRCNLHEFTNFTIRKLKIMCDKPCPSIWIVRTWSPGPVRESNNIGWLNLRPSNVDSVVSTTNWTTTTLTDLERQNWWIDQRRRYSKKMKMVWNYSRPVSKYLHALDLQIGRPTPGLGRGKNSSETVTLGT